MAEKREKTQSSKECAAQITSTAATSRASAAIFRALARLESCAEEEEGEEADEREDDDDDDCEATIGAQPGGH